MSTAFSATLTLIGGKELDAALSRIEQRLQPKILVKATREAAKIVLASARASGAFKDQTGLLRKHLHIKNRASMKRVGSLVLTGKRKDLNIPDDSKGYYPTAVEYGHRHGWGGRPVPPHPYLRPAFDSNVEKAVEIIRETTWNEIRSAWNSGPK